MRLDRLVYACFGGTDQLLELSNVQSVLVRYREKGEVDLHEIRATNVYCPGISRYPFLFTVG